MRSAVGMDVASLPADNAGHSPAAYHETILGWAYCCGVASFLGFYNSSLELAVAYKCHAHPSDWLQPCPDAINGPWLPAILVSLLSLVCCALPPGLTR